MKTLITILIILFTIVLFSCTKKDEVKPVMTKQQTSKYINNAEHVYISRQPRILH